MKKKKISNNELENLISDIKNKKISGVNVTVPFKQEIIPYLDKLSEEAKKTQSVNTVYLEDNKTVGHNTDIQGFQESIKHTKFDVKGKNILILGAGGVVPSIIYGLKRMNVSKIILSNRTKEKAVKLRDLFDDLTVVDWGDLPEFDMIINATSLGLSKKDKFGIDFIKCGTNKFYYDVIYEPFETEFFKAGNIDGNIYENGLNMFLFQAQKAFNIWHDIQPNINEELIKFIRS